MQHQINQHIAQAFQSLQTGKFNEAETSLKEVLRKQPQNFDALHILGLINGIKNQHHEALEFFRKALKIDSSDGFLNFNIAKAFSETGQDEKALKFHLKALEADPNVPERWLNYGKSLSKIKRIDEAISAYGKALELNPNFVEGWTNLGSARAELRSFSKALVAFDHALQINPQFSEAWSNRGIALAEQQKYEEALASYDKAINIKPDYAEAWSNRGIALTKLKKFEEALASYGKAINIKPDYAEAWSNRGMVFAELRKYEEAMASYDKAIGINPSYATAYLNKSFSLLSIGKFDLGWDLYEWRWKAEKSGLKRRFSQPLWLGAEDINGKTILLHAEQGLGDTIQFCRYARLVKARGARVLMEVPQPLLSLLDGLDGVDELVAIGEVLPRFDFHCPLLTLPLAFRTELASIPSPMPYIATKASKCGEWAQKLGATNKPRVGLVWSGSTDHKNDHNRSLTLREVLNYLPQGCEYVSLQKELREVDKEVLAGSEIKHYGEELIDFTDTAALCEQMDVVVSVDTSVAHLAAAIGKTTWILLPYAPDWRWLVDREDSPWYASVRLFRQSNAYDWVAVLEDLRAALKLEEDRRA